MMKLRTLTPLALAFPLLAACGQIVGGFVPPQEITNPAGLDGATMSSSSTLTAAAVKGTLSYDTGKTGQSFDDYKYPDNVPFGIRPHAIRLDASFKSATVSGTCQALPDSFKLTLKSFSATVSDQNGSATLSGQPNQTVTLTKTSGGLGTATYAFGANTFSVSADAATTDKAISILTTGGKNNAAASAEITADADSLAGCQIQFTLSNSKITLSNFS